jgi:hypothetical protein
LHDWEIEEMVHSYNGVPLLYRVSLLKRALSFPLKHE